MTYNLMPHLFTVKERVNQMLFEVTAADRLRAKRETHVSEIQRTDAELAEIHDSVLRIQESL